MLTPEQASAVAAIQIWLTSDEPFFLLRGSAGTGKTFCVKELKGHFAFTAPTNKATKVLRDSVSTLWHRPLCKTIYSLLRLTLDSSGEVKKITKGGDVGEDLKKYTCIIVDEASMIPTAPFEIIKEVAERLKIKFLFMGDPAQLPPVNEKRSPVWHIQTGATLTTVMRYDNAILEFATKLRDDITCGNTDISFVSKHTGQSIELGEGIWKCNKPEFETTVIRQAKEGLFSTPDMSKIVAWRNVQVDAFNLLIRNAIFDNSRERWIVGDRVIFTAPVIGPAGYIIATTDDEGSILDVVINEHASVHGVFKTYIISVKLDFDDAIIGAVVLHEDSEEAYVRKLRQLAGQARAKERSWQDYWAFKEEFNEIKYAYAITAHRSQGSTYDTAFVCWQDIMRNQNSIEALKCLYVASTRPKRALVFT